MYIYIYISSCLYYPSNLVVLTSCHLFFAPPGGAVADAPGRPRVLEELPGERGKKGISRDIMEKM